ncbi:enoyl-CoA hydratase/isomerase family protein [uncultured Albimonas sp.]|uniref:enoyl-CoA hydratase/isomerase family protein n=1 Tax=uncultured Albimonas sp. TaxID=1331701 RepID=UPI0030EE35DA|tara:strand:+ start:2674 stop:3450 length:777 start_codon:yes stop_codon:yes gene_type:complete
MSDASLVRTEKEGRIARIVMEAPPLNALTLPMLDQILAAYRAAAADDRVRAVILCSALEKVFCAGLDLKLLREEGQGGVRALLQKLYLDMLDVQHTMGKPTISAVSGAARGGGMTLSITCNVIVADESATFGYPELDNGLIPAIHFVHLPRVIGRHRAFDLLFSGRSFKAEEAERMGLVARVAPGRGALEAAMEMAENFARQPPGATRIAHAAFMRAQDMDFRREVADVTETFINVSQTEETQAGLAAFAEKRTPPWR